MQQWSDPTWPTTPASKPVIPPMGPGIGTQPGIVPSYPPPSPNPGPNSIPWQQIASNPELAVQMLEILKKLEEIDRKLGKMEQCLVSEPEKENIKQELAKIARKYNL